MESEKQIGLRRMRYNLQLFAKEGAGGEKTEAATPKKLQDARKEGQVAKSIEIITAFMLLGLFLGLKVFIGFIGEGFLKSFKDIYSSMARIVSDEVNLNIMCSIIGDAMYDICIISAPLMLIAFVIAIIFNIAQVKWEPTAKPLMPKFDKINPISGMKKLFSKDGKKLVFSQK